MKEPPPGYDDTAVIARHRLQMLVNAFEKDLKKAPQADFWQMRHAADEIGINVEKLIEIYNQFLNDPSQERMAAVYKELSYLKTLLETH